MKSITTSLLATGTSLAVLPPIDAYVPSAFQYVEVNAELRRNLLAEMQRFRGSVYLSDGAIQPNELTADGRHQLAIDERSWHVLTLDKNGTVSACLRFLPEDTKSCFDDLWLRHAALTNSSRWGFKLRKAVENEMGHASRERISFGEVGGWAVAPDRRLTPDPLRTILSTYGLLQLLGGCSGIATATHRHSSAPMLRRIGLAPLQADGEELPPYYDAQYRCEMEILRFDSRFPNPKYQPWIGELSAYLSESPVIANPLPGASLFPNKTLPQPRALPMVGAWRMPPLAHAVSF